MAVRTQRDEIVFVTADWLRKVMDFDFSTDPQNPHRWSSSQHSYHASAGGHIKDVPYKVTITK